MRTRVTGWLVALFGVSVLITGIVGAVPGGDAVAGPQLQFPPTTLVVHCFPSQFQGFSTIGAAVSAATAGDTIQICAGTYNEDVVIPPGKPLTIHGVGNPTIDASGLDNGVQVLASGTKVTGLTVTNAIGEGILVMGAPGAPVQNVTISGNTVVHNDQGNPTGAPISGSSYPECNGSGQIPGDCGEGIHLMVADNSTVWNNQVSGNSGGILLTDEFGPTDGNVVALNNVSNNIFDCGITVVSHNPGSFANGVPQPSAGGVFNNRIAANTILQNGQAGQGGGVILATPFPGGAVYNNVVQYNLISGNGLAGVTVHSHAPGQDLNGNVINGNYIGTNNLDGDFDFSPAIDPVTTGVLVAAVAPLSITIDNNTIAGNAYGIWMMPAVSATGTTTNTFIQVGFPIVVAP